jgi:hypothetical protein
MSKLLIAGLALIGLGLGLAVFTDANPAMLFIGGVACAGIALIHAVSGAGSRQGGWADPAGEAGGMTNSGDF